MVGFILRGKCKKKEGFMYGTGLRRNMTGQDRIGRGTVTIHSAVVLRVHLLGGLYILLRSNSMIVPHPKADFEKKRKCSNTVNSAVP